ncbi:AEC family transporter [Methylomarinum sp. Ch1-1]|uniref:AEC family transporter n=1 Tax=Methylomarinum roseum TaxID=3067653 RepID=A0AAU7NRT0_9GAMM|nr:AEC family transporter [Methylomarinum sp. Ch1-1]MDP4520308.1 AEC family transporter [Methylomarinum sp. Ch1-1]
MSSTLIQMALIMACGAGWRFLSPAGLSADQTRTVLTSVVYYLFLPAMVLEVLWSADIGLKSFEFSVLGASAVLSGLVATWAVTTLFKFHDRQKGALILAASFPNVTYLGLPVLEQTFGAWARSVAIQLDYFACGPLLFTIGITIARYYGRDDGGSKFILSFLATPPFCAAITAVILNINDIEAPAWLLGVLLKLSGAVVPIMLFSLGLALKWESVRLRNTPYILPVIVIRLLLIPLLLIYLSQYLTMEAPSKAAAILDLSMPSMVLGIVFCDRYQLDSSLYAMAVTVTTLLSLLTLPFWYGML